jgi:integrase
MSRSPKDTSTPTARPRERGSGYIYQRPGSAFWWFAYYWRGQLHRESSHSTDPAIAYKKLDKKVKELWAAKQGLTPFVPKAEKVFVDELLEDLEQDYELKGGRGLPQFLSHLKPIRARFGDMRAVDVTAKIVDDYINKCLVGDKKLGIRPKKPGTINRETALLGQAFRLGIERHVIVMAPHIRSLPEDNARQGFFEKPEFDVVVWRLPEYLQDFSQFAYISAWRKGQLRKSKWEHVKDGVLEAPAENVKNGQPHKIVLEGELAAIIERRWAAREYKRADGSVGISEYIFHRGGKPVGDFRRAWASACKAAGFVKPKLDKWGQPVTVTVDGKKEPVMVPSRLFHDFRRSGVRNMVRSGVRETVAMSISGHKTRAIFDRYNITSDDDQRQAIRQTSEHLAALPTQPKVVAINSHKK